MSDELPEKMVQVPGYEGKDRRTERPPQRAGDIIANNLKLFAAALGIMMSVFAMGGGWMAAKLALEGKVSMTEFARRNASQDQARILLENRQERFERLLMDDIAPDLKEMKLRLRDIYCDGKPPGCQ